jgi:hypothetical protein
LSFIWPTTILCTVAYIDSWYTDQAFDTTLLLLLDKRLIMKTKLPAILKYNPMFVKDIERLPNTGASRLIRFLISNWSNGLIIFEKKFIKRKKNINIYLNKKKSCAHNTKNTKETKNTALRLRFAFALQVSVARRYITLRINNVKNYNLLMKTRVVNKRTNLGNMYLENTNINSAIIANANVTWFIK